MSDERHDGPRDDEWLEDDDSFELILVVLAIAATLAAGILLAELVIP